MCSTSAARSGSGPAGISTRLNPRLREYVKGYFQAYGEILSSCGSADSVNAVYTNRVAKGVS